MKNFKFEHEGKKLWYSRNIATVVCVFVHDYHLNSNVIVVKRGKDVSTSPNKWCLPCGFLDFDETLEQCVVRETKEETNFDIQESRLEFWKLDSMPSKRQIVKAIFHYIEVKKTVEEIKDNLKSYFPKEVSEVKIIPVEDIYLYDFTFNHDFLINIVYQELKEVGKLLK